MALQIPSLVLERFQTLASPPRRVQEETSRAGERKAHVFTQEAGGCLVSEVGWRDAKVTPAVHTAELGSHQPGPGSPSQVCQPPPELLRAAQQGVGHGKPCPAHTAFGREGNEGTLGSFLGQYGDRHLLRKHKGRTVIQEETPEFHTPTGTQWAGDRQSGTGHSGGWKISGQELLAPAPPPRCPALLGCAPRSGLAFYGHSDKPF